MAIAGLRDADRRFMSEAIRLGRAMLGLTTPNPAVGCVIVRDNQIIGKGATGRGGRPHAETAALARAGRRARGATAYVSLEPCAHQGLTPSCARLLAAAGIKRVVIGCLDPYPPVRGRGVRILRSAGVAVTTGVLEDECRRANEGFMTRVTRGRPFALLKLAATLDGRIAAPGGDSRWISSEASRALVHRWRREADAVIVGAGTVMTDNPRLTCRIPGGRDPVRVILDARLATSPRSRVFRERSTAPAILVTNPSNLAHARDRYETPRVEVIGCPERGGELDLGWLMREFGRRGWCRVLIEGGAHTAASAIRSRIVDQIAIFVAPLILGAGLPVIEGLKPTKMRDAIALDSLTVTPVGGDLLIEGRPVKSRARVQ